MKSLTIMLCLVVGLSGVAFAQGITDPAGDNVGPLDLLSARVEMYERVRNGDTDNTETLLKLTIESSPHLPGAIVFEADVDDSTGTGGTASQLGSPVPPCPCKTQVGMDIAISVYTRRQGDLSGSAFCATCTSVGSQGYCGTQREAGEWYALASLGGQPFTALGVIRGVTDPTPKPPAVAGGTVDSYTFPYNTILAYCNNALSEPGAIPSGRKRYNQVKALANPTDAKWQLGIYYDGDYSDFDDVSNTGPLSFNINDWAPNSGLADADAADAITYCEGNFDQDADVDGTDASTFKSNFGRSNYKNPCPTSNAWY